MDSYRAELASAFTRTSLPLSKPIVVHTVAGAGKTTFIRRLIRHAPFPTAITGGTPDPPHISGQRITAPPGPANIVDEYPLVDWAGADVIFADPLQHRGPTLPAHYTSSITHRFGRATCELLSKFGITAESNKEDEVFFGWAFADDPEGAVICLDAEAQSLASWNGLEHLKPCEALGATFPVVTVISGTPLEEADAVDRYIALTRHTRLLRILL
ncbi:TGB 1 [Mint virus X]|uniref:TGB 1 n=1 Tax=Mint virus X TaxID=301865 RepID=Q5G7H2_9VIRU|nr:TGB 1 [Mint virus X]AAW67747.1 TGB 1 [Mint virus X]